MYSSVLRYAEGDREDDLEIGCCLRAIEEGTALLSVIVHSATYVVYKRGQRGLREPLGSSKDSYFDGLRVKGR